MQGRRAFVPSSSCSRRAEPRRDPSTPRAYPAAEREVGTRHGPSVTTMRSSLTGSHSCPFLTMNTRCRALSPRFNPSPSGIGLVEFSPHRFSHELIGSFVRSRNRLDWSRNNPCNPPFSICCCLGRAPLCTRREGGRRAPLGRRGRPCSGVPSPPRGLAPACLRWPDRVVPASLALWSSLPGLPVLCLTQAPQHSTISSRHPKIIPTAWAVSR